MLMEVCCGPESLLTSTIQTLTGQPGSASRCSRWNCGDLGSGAGLKLALQRLEVENPSHVWMSPPCGPYSPLQNVNSRNPEQRAELEEKRAEAMRIYVSSCVILRVCVQKGIHVTLELSERCQAWRLPLLHNLQTKYSLHSAVARGCRVGLRSRRDGQLMRKGWKIVTSCRRLAEELDLPCRCARNYQHGRCEGIAAKESELYTPEFTRRAGKAILQELDHAAVLSEAIGSSSLPCQFGEGMRCMCSEVSLPKRKQLCGHCLLQADVITQESPVQQGRGSREQVRALEGIGLGGPGVLDAVKKGDCDARVWLEGQGSGGDPQVNNSEAGHMSSSSQEGFPEQLCQYSQESIAEVERMAHAMWVGKRYRHSECEQLLELLPFRPKNQSQGKLPNQKAVYLTLGAYSYGNHYGITHKTRILPHFTKYLLAYLNQHDPDKTACSSVVIILNGRCVLHRDVHNQKQYPNRLMGLGNYQGGGLWVEESEQKGQGDSGLESREVGDQQVVWGRVHSTHHKVVKFLPGLWHETETWSGSRSTVTSYVTRGHSFLEQQDREFLGSLGFRLPPKVPLSEEANAVGPMGPRRAEDPKTFKERIRKQLYLLHAATGHSSLKHMIDMLKRRNVDPKVLEIAQEFRCSVCSEKKQVQPRHLASLEVLPPKWHTVSADIGHWRHPGTGEHVQFMLIIDEGSRFRVARILSKGSKQQPNAATCLGYLREGWSQYFGMPRTLRSDPAGNFRGQAVVDFCDREGIYLDHAPADAHWQIGVCEQAVRGTKEVLEKLSSVEPDLSPETLLATTVGIFNQRETIRGFSPIQHAFGRSPDSTGRLLASCNGFPDDVLVESGDQEFEQSARLRAEAEKAHSEWNAAQRISRAINSKPRPQAVYQPGDLVYYWRSQVSGQGRRQPGSKRGHFLGPARVLAMESRKNPDGAIRAGSTLWCVRGRQLIKCSPEQLRPASEREEMLELLAKDHGQAETPWTFNKLSEEIGGTQFQDLTGEVPDAQEWQRAQDPQREAPPIRFRFRGKRTAPEPLEDEEVEQPAGAEPSQSSRPARDRGIPSSLGMTTEKRQTWQERVPDFCWAAEECSFWADQGSAVEVEIPLPGDHKQFHKALDNLPAFFAGAMRRQAVEVNERKLNETERKAFAEAKNIEVRNFLSAQAFESLPAHLQPSREQAVNMRWLLTWKLKDDGSHKAKARAVLLGYQDPQYEFRSTTAPVMTKQTRQFLLQMAANESWDVHKGDVSGAFLQGRPYPGEMYCIPCPEICQAMGIPENSVTRLRKACYGLVEAPLEWCRTISEFLESLGLVRIWSDACCWVWRDQGRTQGVVSGHVDDFLFTGSDQNPRWRHIIEQIKAKFKWGDWEKNQFTQCGVQVQRSGTKFVLSQSSYVNGVVEIPVNSSRRRHPNEATTPWEKSKLRALLGALSWHAQQVAPHVSADVGLLLSEVNTSTVSTLLRANTLLANTKARKDHQMVIHQFPLEVPLGLFAWVDASSQNRVCGGSTEGLFIGMAPMSLQQGEVCEVTPIIWHSHKIDRVCRSPGAAETQAAVNGEDHLYYARYQWSEMIHGPANVKDPDASVTRVPGCVVSDSRNVYDKLQTEVVSIKGAEKRSNIELLSLKEAQHRTQVTVRWVHSEAQLGNALTKAGGGKELELYYKMGHRWRIVEDKQMRSARRRRTDGLTPLQSTSTAAVDEQAIEQQATLT